MSIAGVSITGLASLAQEINQLDRLILRGLMVIPTKTDNTAQQKSAFQHAYQLFLSLQNQYSTIDTLSMGMTGDMDSAIKEGSTMIRVGTGIFGQRHTPSE